MTTLTTNRDRLSLRLRKQGGETFVAVIGDNDGKIWPSKSSKGYVYIREELSVDENGNMTYGEPYLVRDVGNDFVPYRNARVRVKWDDFDKEWELERAVHSDLLDNNINPATFNSANPFAKQPSLSAMPPLKTFAVSTENTPTTEVSVRNFVYRSYKGTLNLFSLSGFSRPDLADYAPASGQHRLAHLWLLSGNTIGVTTSTAKSVNVPLTYADDLAECLNTTPNNEDSAHPIGAWVITGDDTTITDASLFADTREWVNTPEPYIRNQPNTIANVMTIDSDRNAVMAGSITVTGTLTVEGTLTIV